MEWDQTTRDDVAHSLRQVLEFFGKTPSDGDMRMWLAGVKHRRPMAVKQGLKRWLEIGKSAPRPGHINELIDQEQGHGEHRELPPPVMETNCPKEIAQAWSWYIQLRSGGMVNFGVKAPDPETQERYLHLVNHEARRLNQPDAIDDEHKLQEVWG